MHIIQYIVLSTPHVLPLQYRTFIKVLCMCVEQRTTLCKTVKWTEYADCRRLRSKCMFICLCVQLMRIMLNTITRASFSTQFQVVIVPVVGWVINILAHGQHDQRPKSNIRFLSLSHSVPHIHSTKSMQDHVAHIDIKILTCCSNRQFCSSNVYTHMCVCANGKSFIYSVAAITDISSSLVPPQKANKSPFGNSLQLVSTQ